MSITSNLPPPDFNAIYFDTNALLEAGWPDPSVLLHNIFVIGGWWRIQMLLPEPVVKEAEEHWLRKVTESVSRLDSAARELERVAKPAVSDAKAEYASVELMLEQYRAKRNEVVTKYAIAISPFTKRSIEDIFDLATKYVMPFEHDKKGKGFQDTVILASILEHLSIEPSLKAVLITKDGAFGKSNYGDLIGGFDGRRLRICDLNTVWEELFRPYFNETIVKPWEEERRNALTAAKEIVLELQNFLGSHLAESMLRTESFGTVVKFLSVDAVEINSVDTPIPETEQIADREVEFTIAASARCTAIVRKSSLFTIWGMSENSVKTPVAPEDAEEKVSWSGGIRATADIVNRQFRNIVLQSLVSEEELRTKWQGK
jgi:hypothetical protein